MTIIVPDHYHARRALEDNHITCIAQELALRQDIRPLRIGMLPTEPLSLMEQVNLLRPLGMSIIQAVPILLRGPSSEEGLDPEEFLSVGRLDGLVVVGSALHEPAPAFRNRLGPLLEAMRPSCPTLGLGYGALWLTELLGVGYESLPKARIGVWEAENRYRDHPIAGESDDVYLCPQVRRFRPQGDSFQQLVAAGALQVLATCADEALIWETPDHAWSMHLGNPEYTTPQLLRAFSQRSDFVGPGLFDLDRPVSKWKTHRNVFFTSWLKHCYNCLSIPEVS